MKQLTLAFVLIFSTQVHGQDNFLSFETALKESKVEGKSIMMVFSGSDWCKPCIELKKKILETPEFAQVEENLIFLYLDFPYKKANRLSKEETKHNERLAERYNPNGYFPQILVLNSEGEVKDQVSYEKGMMAENFIRQLKKSL